VTLAVVVPFVSALNWEVISTPSRRALNVVVPPMFSVSVTGEVLRTALLVGEVILAVMAGGGGGGGGVGGGLFWDEDPPPHAWRSRQAQNSIRAGSEPKRKSLLTTAASNGKRERAALNDVG
jgi:hypothetical protein